MPFGAHADAAAWLAFVSLAIGDAGLFCWFIVSLLVENVLYGMNPAG
jgi:hypothetical protein